ncbi:sigma factor [Azospirillum sp. TSO5]|uniref:RNA polymerase sigma factor n=1 Tax=Azospirillum sp. TSO5 TaxID=716760 RepID=UPI000D61A311|nr:sigma factor [Azospirillum sp. TSO5]PWC97710.1 hypothetical protein TSO5_04175 [Azospirillum sp. TSO5]
MLECRTALRAQALKLTHNKADADDLLQDTLTRAIERRDLFDGTNMGGWLRVIMRNLFVNSRLLHANKLEHIPLDALEGQPDPDRDAPRRPDHIALPAVAPTQESAVDLADTARRMEGNLSLEQRLALLKVSGEGRSYIDVAAEMSLTTGAIKQRISSGRALMRRLREMEMDE